MFYFKIHLKARLAAGRVSQQISGAASPLISAQCGLQNTGMRAHKRTVEHSQTYRSPIVKTAVRALETCKYTKTTLLANRALLLHTCLHTRTAARSHRCSHTLRPTVWASAAFHSEFTMEKSALWPGAFSTFMKATARECLVWVLRGGMDWCPLFIHQLFLVKYCYVFFSSSNQQNGRLRILSFIKMTIHLYVE